MEPFGGLAGMLIALGVMVLIFFICRSLLLWYWKLDKIEEHLAAIRKSLEGDRSSDKKKQNIMKNEDSGIGI